MNALKTIYEYWSEHTLGFWTAIVVIALLLRWIALSEALVLELLILLFCIEDHLHTIRRQLAVKTEKKDTLLLS